MCICKWVCVSARSLPATDVSFGCRPQRSSSFFSVCRSRSLAINILKIGREAVGLGLVGLERLEPHTAAKTPRSLGRKGASGTARQNAMVLYVFVCGKQTIGEKSQSEEVR